MAIVLNRPPTRTDWTSYTPSSYTGLGTPTNVMLEWKRNGSHMEIRGELTAGTITGVGQSIALPLGSILTSNAISYQLFGYITRSAGSEGSTLSIIALNGDTFLKAGNYIGHSAGTFNPLLYNTTGIIGTGERINIQASFPITGWTVNN